MKKRIVLLLAVATMSVGMLAGCGKTENTTEEIGTTTESEAEKPEVTEEPEAEAEPTEEVTEPETEEPTEAETEAETEETTETETEETTETETPATETQTEPEYTYTDMSAAKYAQKSVNVRDLPNTDGAKLGSLSVNQEVNVTGQCNETSWYRIEYKGGVAYVSNNYLGDNKVEEKKPEPKPENNQPADNPAPEPEQTAECPYTLYQLIDEGGANVYYYYLVGDHSQQHADVFNACLDIIEQRMADAGYPNAGIVGSGDTPTPYYVNGVRVHRAIVYLGQENPDGTMTWNTDVL